MRCGAIWTIEGFIRGGRVGLPKVAKEAPSQKDCGGIDRDSTAGC